MKKKQAEISLIRCQMALADLVVETRNKHMLSNYVSLLDRDADLDPKKILEGLKKPQRFNVYDMQKHDTITKVLQCRNRPTSIRYHLDKMLRNLENLIIQSRFKENQTELESMEAQLSGYDVEKALEEKDADNPGE